MDDWEQDVHERGGGDDAVQEPEQRSEQPAARVDRGEDRVVDERERLSGRQVQQVSERFGAPAIAGDGGAEQEWQVDAGEAQLIRRSQGGGQHQRADEAAGEGSPDAHGRRSRWRSRPRR